MKSLIMTSNHICDFTSFLGDDDWATKKSHKITTSKEKKEKKKKKDNHFPRRELVENRLSQSAKVNR